MINKYTSRTNIYQQNNKRETNCETYNLKDMI